MNTEHVRGRVPALDGLRGVAILLVVFGHAAGLLHPGLLSGGHIGIQVFFVLSGFLITRLLLDEAGRTGRVSLAGFYLRRASRLLPALAVAGAVTIGVQWGYWPWNVVAWSVIGPATFTSNWLILAEKPVWITGWSWSLAIEEQFYLVWAPLLSILCLRPRRLRTWFESARLSCRLLVSPGG